MNNPYQETEKKYIPIVKEIITILKNLEK